MLNPEKIATKGLVSFRIFDVEVQKLILKQYDTHYLYHIIVKQPGLFGVVLYIFALGELFDRETEVALAYQESLMRAWLHALSQGKKSLSFIETEADRESWSHRLDRLIMLPETTINHKLTAILLKKVLVENDPDKTLNAQLKRIFGWVVSESNAVRMEGLSISFLLRAYLPLLSEAEINLVGKHLLANVTNRAGIVGVDIQYLKVCIPSVGKGELREIVDAMVEGIQKGPWWKYKAVSPMNLTYACALLTACIPRAEVGELEKIRDVLLEKNNVGYAYVVLSTLKNLPASAWPTSFIARCIEDLDNDDSKISSKAFRILEICGKYMNDDQRDKFFDAWLSRLEKNPGMHLAPLQKLTLMASVATSDQLRLIFEAINTYLNQDEVSTTYVAARDALITCAEDAEPEHLSLVLDTLLSYSSSPNPKKRESIANALGECAIAADTTQITRIINQLIQLLSDDVREVRFFACHGLVRCAVSANTAQLTTIIKTSLFRDPNDGVRSAQAVLLEECATCANTEQVAMIIDSCRMYLNPIPKSYVKVLHGCLGKANDEDFRYIVRNIWVREFPSDCVTNATPEQLVVIADSLMASATAQVAGLRSKDFTQLLNVLQKLDPDVIRQKVALVAEGTPGHELLTLFLSGKSVAAVQPDAGRVCISRIK